MGILVCVYVPAVLTFAIAIVSHVRHENYWAAARSATLQSYVGAFHYLGVIAAIACIRSSAPGDSPGDWLLTSIVASVLVALFSSVFGALGGLLSLIVGIPFEEERRYFGCDRFLVSVDSVDGSDAEG